MDRFCLIHTQNDTFPLSSMKSDWIESFKLVVGNELHAIPLSSDQNCYRMFTAAIPMKSAKNTTRFRIGLSLSHRPLSDSEKAFVSLPSRDTITDEDCAAPAKFPPRDQALRD